MTSISPSDVAVGTQTHRLRFHGDGLTFLGLMLVNGLLTVITLGVYAFWARTEQRRYLVGQLELSGDRFAYHGTGGELLRGWLKVMGVLLLVGLGFVAVTAALQAALGKAGAMVGALLIYPMIFCLVPFAIVGARRYQLSRTSLRGIRFSFRGTGWEFAGIFLKGMLLTLLTLGFYGPYMSNAVYAYMMNNTYYGSRRFHYDGNGADLFKMYVPAFFLSLVTLGIYWLFYTASRTRYQVGHTHLGDLRFESTLTGGKMLGLILTNLLLFVFTLGLGTAWIIVRNINFTLENILLHGSLELSDVKQERRAAGAGGAEMADALDADVDVGAGLGM
jgi:uncharacterized membrane protein YjgN (DUF898 family)